MDKFRVLVDELKGKVVMIEDNGRYRLLTDKDLDEDPTISEKFGAYVDYRDPEQTDEVKGRKVYIDRKGMIRFRHVPNDASNDYVLK